MDIEKAKEFKHLLFEGPVKFSFTKQDGTIREAVGTMNEALLPKTEPIVAKFGVEVDTWAESENTPKRHKFKVGLTQAEIDKFGANEMGNVIEAAILKKTGCTAKTFSYWQIDIGYDDTPRKMPAGSVLFYDLERKGYRSCKLDTIISFEAKA